MLDALFPLITVAGLSTGSVVANTTGMRLDATTSLSILSAMITPVIMILASGQLVLATSQRLSRLMDRVRKVTERLRDFAEKTDEQALQKFLREEHPVLLLQIERMAKRARLLQRSMAFLYLALGAFVATSISIGAVELFSLVYAWIPIVFGVLGAALLFSASLLLITESRVAMASVHAEVDFALRISRSFSGAADLMHSIDSDKKNI